MAKVLVIGTSHKTRGGITSVIKAHQLGNQWTNFNCEWIETHIDRSAIEKVAYFIIGLLKFILKVPFSDIVHIHLAAVERKIPFVFFTKLFGKKLILHLHFPDPKTTIYNNSKSSRYKWCINKADKVIVLSNTWKQLIEKEWNVKNLIVIYNPCPQIIPTPEYKYNHNQPYILYAGNLIERKGYKDLLNAFALVHDSMPEWKIVFAGNGEIDQAQYLVNKLGLCHSVIFTGWITNEKKDKIFREATAYCLPSYAEGFPMGVLDAWAYNLPVITTPVGGLPDIISNYNNALVFKQGDIKELANCLKALTSIDLRIKLSQASKQLATTEFAIKKINKDIQDLYISLINASI